MDKKSNSTFEKPEKIVVIGRTPTFLAAYPEMSRLVEEVRTCFCDGRSQLTLE